MLHPVPVPKMMPLQSDLAKCAAEVVRLELESSGFSSDDQYDDDTSISPSSDATSPIMHLLPLQYALAKKAEGVVHEGGSNSRSEYTTDNDEVFPNKRIRQVAEKVESKQEEILHTLERCASNDAWAKELVKAFWTQTIDLQNAKMALEQRVSDVMIASRIERNTLEAQLAEADKAAVKMRHEFAELVRQIRADTDRESIDLMTRLQSARIASQIEKDSLEAQLEAVRSKLNDACMRKIQADNAAIWMKQEFVEKLRQTRIHCDREAADLRTQLQEATEEMEQLEWVLADLCFEKEEIEQRFLHVAKELRESKSYFEMQRKANICLLNKERATIEALWKDHSLKQKASLNSVVVGGVEFQYELSRGRWESMAPEKSNDVLKKYIDFMKTGRGRTMTYEAAGNTYEVSFATMTQNNTATRKERNIRYKFNIPADWSTSDVKLMQLKCLQRLISCNDCVVEITDASRLAFFTQLLKNSIHHHGRSCAVSACVDLGASLQVKQAWRVEDVFLRQAYENCKRDMGEQLGGATPQKIDPPLVAALAAFGKECHVDPDINEAMLFHGTKRALLEKIVTAGFDDRLAKAGYYGRGTYFASQVCKSMQYVDSDALILISRVLLGDPHFATKVNSKMRRPPEKNMRVCDSVIARPGVMLGHSTGYQSHQEFVIFERAQAYPEYVLML